MDVRVIFSMVLSFLVSAVAGRFLVPALRALKAGQSIKEIGPTWHMTKQGTPTMGGLMFILSMAVVLVVLGWKDLVSGRLGGLYTYLFALVFGAIGFLDDYMKVKKKENTGLTAGPKFLLQLAAAVVFTILLRNEGYLTADLYIPFVNVTFQLPWVVYMVFAAFVMVGTVNAVNITDGIDGLSSSVTVPVALFFTVTATLWGRSDISLIAGALVGGLLGFLIYNFHPAKVFMGDTGSLFMGGMVCGLAFALDMPLILILVGIIYIAETLSDIIQVTYFKLTHGKRIFRMAPLHHHFEMGGWSEVKLVAVFTTVTVVFCLLAWLGVMNRYPL